MATVFVSHPTDKLETVAQLGALLAGEMPTGVVSPDRADHWRRWLDCAARRAP